jgi:hypothetical protein
VWQEYVTHLAVVPPGATDSLIRGIPDQHERMQKLMAGADRLWLVRPSTGNHI